MMSRRTSSNLWNFGILALVGFGIYWAWRSGALSQLSQSISQALGGGAQGPSDIDQLIDQEIQKLNDALAQAQEAQAAQIADIVDKLQKQLANRSQKNAFDDLVHGATNGAEKDANKQAADAANKAAKLALASIPIWLGTSPQAAEFTHQANVAITHAIGQKTGREKGVRTVFTRHGPILVNKETHLCYNMAGKEIPCPDPSEVIGIATADYEALVEEVSA